MGEEEDSKKWSPGFPFWGNEKTARGWSICWCASVVLIPMKVGSDSDLIPVTRSGVMAVTIGAKRRWRRDRA